MDLKAFQTRFLDQIDSSSGLDLLFNYVPEVRLFVKNRHSQFTRANRAMLEMLGLKREDQLLGRTDLDFFAREIGQKYIDEDRQVMRQDRPFVNRIWLVPDSDGTLAWYLCTKMPLRDRAGQVIGIAGILRDYKTAGAVLEPYREMAAIIEYISHHYPETIRVAELAAMAHLSVSQFERRFQKLFHLSPIQYINKIRVHMACQALSQTDQNITQIALDCGFYDHSYFTKKFRQEIGLTPRQYRRRHHQSV